MNFKEEVIKKHDSLIDEFGGSKGILDEGRLDSSLQQPFSGFGGVDFYPGTVKKASRLSFNLIKNHCFIDGNKRIGTYILQHFLEKEGFKLDLNDDELRDLILDVATSKIDYEEFSDIISEHVT